MKTLPDNSVDAIVADPPAGINFMNMKFDSDRGGRQAWIAWMTEIATECLRVIKPGGHALIWALPRTSHWTATAWEDAGFELRDCLYHLFGSGFPKSMDVSKQLDRIAGAEREVIGSKVGLPGYRNGETGPQVNAYGNGLSNGSAKSAITAPATDAAKQWDGWGTALKPSAECWWLLRKPLSESSIAANVLRWGTGTINVDACRIPTNGDDPNHRENNVNHSEGNSWYGRGTQQLTHHGMNKQGRWPSHVILDEEAARLLDRQSGMLKSGKPGMRTFTTDKTFAGIRPKGDIETGYGDTGGASRFFLRVEHDAEDELTRFLYCSKASRRDRNNDGAVNNTHPTCKSTQLMTWLCRLICPPGGVILDPFLGSGTTMVAAVLEGFDGIGIDCEPEYLAIAEKRVEHAVEQRRIAEAQMQMSLIQEVSA
jgi:site-specific DNA-methyltransferase (adenine-specific)